MTHSLHIIGSRQLGGAETFFARLVTALAERGHPVTAVVRPRAPVRDLLPTGVPVYPVALANNWDPASRLRIRALVRRLRPDVVQTYMGRATRLTRLGPGDPPHVARLGGYYRLGPYRHADAWVGNTRGIRDYLREYGLPPGRIFHITNCLEPPPPPGPEETGALRGELGIPEGAWVVGAVGRLQRKKGFDTLLDALARLPERLAGRPVFLVIAGDGPEAGSLRRQAGALGVAGRVRWAGHRSPPGTVYALAHIVAVPSRHEPLGNVILEAWAHRRPILATRTHGAEELLTPGETGHLVPPDDPEALAAGLRRLLEAPEPTRAALAEAGFGALRRTHGADAVCAAYESLYAELRRQGKRRRPARPLGATPGS